MAVTDRVGPYVEQLLDNQDAQASIQHAVTRARQAYGAATGKKTTKKALGDKRVRRRATQSVTAARDAVISIVRGRAEQQAKADRRGRNRRLLTAAAVLTTALLALATALRPRKLGLFGGSVSASEQPGESVDNRGTDEPSPATPTAAHSTPVIELAARKGART